MSDNDQNRDLFGNLPYAGKPPSVRHSETSQAAAERIKYRIGPLHRQIIDFLTRNPRGASDERMQSDIPMPANTQRPRRRELELVGRVADSGRRELTESKREAVIWVLKENLDPLLACPLPEPQPISLATNAYYDKQGRLIHDKCAVEGCTKSAGNGVGVYLNKGILGMWYCFEHWPNNPNKQA